MIRTALLSVVLVTTALPAWAEQVPRPGPADTRVRTVVYQPQNVVGVDSSYGTATMVVLGESEKIETIAVGDSLGWRVEPNKRGNIILIKPVERAVATNMHVVTDRRHYTFVLRSNDRPAEDQVYRVQFRYPDEETEARLIGAARRAAGNPNSKAFRWENANLDYGYKGSEFAKPARVFDDGVKTWFRFHGEVPAIFIVDRDRKESLVNHRREGEFIVVDKINYQWTLRNGDEVTCVFNLRKPNPAGAATLAEAGPRKLSPGLFGFLSN